MGSLQSELATKWHTPASQQSAPEGARQDNKLDQLGEVRSQMEAVCKEFADRLQPLSVLAERYRAPKELKSAIKMALAQAVQARRVASSQK